MAEVIAGEVDAATSMSFNEMFYFDDKDIPRKDLTIFRLQDLGLNFPEDGIYTSRRMWETNREACSRFALASLQGWNYAAQNPEEALDIVMHYTRRSPFPTTRLHQERMLAEITGMIEVGSHRQGTLSEADFGQVVAALKSIGQIDREPSYRDFYVGLTPADSISGRVSSSVDSPLFKPRETTTPSSFTES